MEAFLAEYDWGVPLYRAVWQPLFLAASAALVFTAARAWGGRGGALGAWGIYAIVRLLATLMPVLAGRSPSAMPLLLASARVRRSWRRSRRRRAARPLAFGATAGLACGTVGFAAEYGWSQLVMPLPWSRALIAEGAADLDRRRPGRRHARRAARVRPAQRPAVAARDPRRDVRRAGAARSALGVNARSRRSRTPARRSSSPTCRPAPDREARGHGPARPARRGRRRELVLPARLAGQARPRGRPPRARGRAASTARPRPIPLEPQLEGRPAPAARPRPRRGAGAPAAGPRRSARAAPS